MTFVMSGCREALSSPYCGPHVQRLVEAIEGAVFDMPPLAFDLAKSLIETACKSIMQDRGLALDDRADLPRLLRETLTCLGLLREGHSEGTRAAASLRKTVNGLQTVIQGLCELRNEEGLSHGKDPSHVPLGRIHALMAARSADAVVHFLFATHSESFAKVEGAPLSYLDNEAFNDFLDEEHPPVTICGLSYKASEILFTMDPEAYQELLQGFLDQRDTGDPSHTGEYV
jgi:hypothetical protein